MNPFSALAAKIYAGLFGASLALVVLQTVRIEGLWFVTGLEEKLGGAREALIDEKAERETERADWRNQVATAVAARAAAETKSKEIATDAQASHDALAADNAGLRDYIARNSLRSTSAGASAAAAGAAGDLGSGLPTEPAGPALVATSEADLVTCDDAYVYAAGAYQFAKELIAGGLAK